MSRRIGILTKGIADYLSLQIDKVSHKLCLTGKPEFCDLDKIETRSEAMP